MNPATVVTACTVSAPGFVNRSFSVGEKVPSYSPYYWSLVWSGNATVDSSYTETALEKVFRPTVVVVSDDDPEFGGEGVWIQTFPNGDWTMWIEDGA